VTPQPENMRVLIVNTYEQAGGAAIAANRLMKALTDNGVKVKMLVGRKLTDNIQVVGLPSPWRHRLHFLWERWCIFCHKHFSRRDLFAIDIANCGTDITRMPEFREADIIHLHWINQGMLSLNDIERILDSGKPVVWTMHDAWEATAVCHVTLDCQQYTKQCADCPMLPRDDHWQTAHKAWTKKYDKIHRHEVRFVACSQWLAGLARQSSMLKHQRVTAIPNPIDTRTFKPSDKLTARQALKLPEQGHVLLFAAQRASNPLKGMGYLKEALTRLASDDPTLASQLTLAILGSDGSDVAAGLPVRSVALGYIADEQRMAVAYSAADAFVLPSFSENLPNTIMEAMACGVPCVGFEVGGIPEMIDHKENGYVARYKDSADLARGLHWTLCEASHDELAAAALKKVHTHYAASIVARQYAELYEWIMEKNVTSRP